jgi:hypothetical protein
MNKIEIKINHSALKEICYLIEDAQLHQIWTPEQKAVASIMSGLVVKLLKKEIDKRHTTKKFKMTFKYHEGFALEQSCRAIYFHTAGDIYSNHAALNIANQIHKQL